MIVGKDLDPLRVKEDATKESKFNLLSVTSFYFRANYYMVVVLVKTIRL